MRRWLRRARTAKTNPPPAALLRSPPCTARPSRRRLPPAPPLAPAPAPARHAARVRTMPLSRKLVRSPTPCPPSSPRALPHNDWAYDPAACPVERQHPGMQRDKAEIKPTVHTVTTIPCDLNNIKKIDGEKLEDGSLSSDQLVPDSAARPDEIRTVSDGRSQTISPPSENCPFKKIDISLKPAEEALLNGTGEEISLKKEKMSQNLLQWTVADVASYFSAAGFPEQAVAFRTQEIDGKSLLLMQRSDVLTGLSIRLGPALKIYERHVKVLQRTHFLECENI
uniref:SAM domain-containing protein n=1 Tax=Oryzias latipes TaxID=8090 RepID=A0A3P9HUW9_ORYLA